MTPLAPAVRLRQVVKHFQEGEGREARELALFQGLDADFPAGRITALMGPSGSGKSTLLNLVAGIDLPDAGEVWIHDHPMHRLSERDRTLFRRRSIGFVFQFFNLIPTLTVLENVRLPLELLGGPPQRDRAETLLARVGLLHRGNTFPDRLSGGERQRVALVRALAHRPALILADEPTGNLDHDTARAVMALLTALAREEGSTVILVTHSAEVAAAADHVQRLEDGRLHPWGTG